MSTPCFQAKVLDVKASSVRLDLSWYSDPQLFGVDATFAWQILSTWCAPEFEGTPAELGKRLVKRVKCSSPRNGKVTKKTKQWLKVESTRGEKCLPCVTYEIEVTDRTLLRAVPRARRTIHDIYEEVATAPASEPVPTATTVSGAPSPTTREQFVLEAVRRWPRPDLEQLSGLTGLGLVLLETIVEVLAKAEPEGWQAAGAAGLFALDRLGHGDRAGAETLARRANALMAPLAEDQVRRAAVAVLPVALRLKSAPQILKFSNALERSPTNERWVNDRSLGKQGESLDGLLFAQALGGDTKTLESTLARFAFVGDESLWSSAFCALVLEGHHQGALKLAARMCALRVASGEDDELMAPADLAAEAFWPLLTREAVVRAREPECLEWILKQPSSRTLVSTSVEVGLVIAGLARRDRKAALVFARRVLETRPLLSVTEPLGQQLAAVALSLVAREDEAEARAQLKSFRARGPLICSAVGLPAGELDKVDARDLPLLARLTFDRRTATEALQLALRLSGGNAAQAVVGLRELGELKVLNRALDERLSGLKRLKPREVFADDFFAMVGPALRPDLAALGLKKCTPPTRRHALECVAHACARVGNWDGATEYLSRTERDSTAWAQVLTTLRAGHQWLDLVPFRSTHPN